MSSTISAGCSRALVAAARAERTAVRTQWAPKRLHSSTLTPAKAVSVPTAGTAHLSFARNRAHQFRRYATVTSQSSSPTDLATFEANACLEQGTQKLEEGDVEGAKALYKRSVEIKREPGALFNLGVTHYHLKEFDEAIEAWEESIKLQPASPDAHTNLASAYIISDKSRPDLALQHLRIASSLAPEDPEIAFNLAAVLEACGRLEEALTQYKRSKANGVDRAEFHIRNVSAKLLGQKMKAASAASNRKPDSEEAHP